MKQQWINTIVEVIKEHNETFRLLASNPEHYHTVYYCPKCESRVEITNNDHIVTGEYPICKECGTKCIYNYERE
jgi:uncharacterized protein YlaI